MPVPLAEADARCGTKAANLGRLLRAGFPVPDGFVTDGRGDLAAALRRLGPGPFAVRSSGPFEDGSEASYAGQLHTTLNVTTPELAEAVRRTVDSGGGAAAYAARTGRPARGPVSAIVQVMVQAEAAGVAFTRHPVTGADEAVIEATTGLGDRLVDGTVTPDRWILTGETPTAPGEGGVLTAREAHAVARLARRAEALFGHPQDVEWAIADGTVWVLQSRPITTGRAPTTETTDGRPLVMGTATGPEEAADRRTTDGRVLVVGTAAGPGVAAGTVRVVSALDDFGRFGAGDVLVCRTTSPAWTPLLAKAAAVVTETGGMLAHAAIVAREFGIPAVVAAEGATTALADGRPVVVDGTRGTVTAAEGTTR
jgi:pyruvate, water dikinase